MSIRFGGVTIPVPVRIPGLPMGVDVLDGRRFVLKNGANYGVTVSLDGGRIKFSPPAVQPTPIRDANLQFLKDCTSEELAPLERALVKEGGATCFLRSSAAYKAHPNDRTKYVGELCHELQLFGGNSIANALRGGKGVPYSEILRDVADEMDVKRTSGDSVVEIERKLLAKVLRIAWEKMSPEEQKQVQDELGCQWLPLGGVAASSFVTIFNMGGFASYKLAMIIVNGIAKSFLGRGLSLAANAGICKALSIATGPVGWIVSGAWTVLDIASPAYRVTVPAVTYIAALRMMKTSAVKSQVCEAA